MKFHLISLALALSALYASAQSSPQAFSTRSAYASVTNSYDVQGLRMLQNSYPLVLSGWSGDPCYPVAWTWVRCSSDTYPRIIGLYLSGLGLVSPLPDFGTMAVLMEIDLSNNPFTGPVPSFLGSFRYLTKLNLGYTGFCGPTPSSFSKISVLTLYPSNIGKSCSAMNTPPTGTPSIDTPSKPKKARVKIKGLRIALPITGSTAAIVLIGLACWCLCKTGGEDEEEDALKEKGAADDNDTAAESELSSSSKAPGAKGK